MEEGHTQRPVVAQTFQTKIGDKNAFVEIISVTNSICSVQIEDQPPIFVTRIRGDRGNFEWVSIPQGNNELAAAIGVYIEDHLKEKRSQ
ncbi:MAG TPA: hypothetical protein VGC95_00730 [Chitinophagaceae bacterium]